MFTSQFFICVFVASVISVDHPVKHQFVSVRLWPKMTSIVDSEAHLAKRATEVGLTDGALQSLSRSSLSTLGRLAFAHGQPGTPIDAVTRALEGSQPSKSVTWQNRGSVGSLDQNMVCSKPFEFATCITDGGGLASTADWSTPQYSKDIFLLLRKRFESLAVKWGVVQRLMSGGGSTDSLLLPDEINIVQMELVQFLEAEGFKCDAKIEPHQPFLLDAWRAMSQLSGDVDSQLPKLLAAGVPTGILEPICRFTKFLGAVR